MIGTNASGRLVLKVFNLRADDILTMTQHRLTLLTADACGVLRPKLGKGADYLMCSTLS